MQWHSLARGLSVISARICISAASGGGGKTLLSLGLARIWKNAGLAVKTFKKGPDYIDAAWLAAASGAPTTNLDPFFLDQSGIRQLFARAVCGAGIAVIEGNRGLYDGLNESGSCSTAQIARSLKAPVLLSLDCRKVTRTVAAIIRGLTAFEPGLDFCGVILNRTGSGRHEASLVAAIEANTDVKVLGALPRLKANPLPERHMGIASAGNCLAYDLEARLEQIAGFVKEHCDTAAILDCARAAPELPAPGQIARTASCPSVRIGVVRDKALWFYYPENIEALETAGAEISYLSLFDNSEAGLARWQGLHGLYLGGGFPEDYCEEIANSQYLPLLRRMAQAGMPVYAECGGMILLARTFRRGNANWQMANVFGHDIVWSSRPQGLGYVEGRVSAANPWYEQGLSIRGHEFHYSAASGPGEILRLGRGTGACQKEAGTDGFCANRVWASYTHIFAPAVPEWAPAFIRLAEAYKRESAADSDHLAASDSCF